MSGPVLVRSDRFWSGRTNFGDQKWSGQTNFSRPNLVRADQFLHRKSVRRDQFCPDQFFRDRPCARKLKMLCVQKRKRRVLLIISYKSHKIAHLVCLCRHRLRDAFWLALSTFRQGSCESDQTFFTAPTQKIWPRDYLRTISHNWKWTV